MPIHIRHKNTFTPYSIFRYTHSHAEQMKFPTFDYISINTYLELYSLLKFKKSDCIIRFQIHAYRKSSLFSQTIITYILLRIKHTTMLKCARKGRGKAEMNEAFPMMPCNICGDLGVAFGPAIMCIFFSI